MKFCVNLLILCVVLLEHNTFLGICHQSLQEFSSNIYDINAICSFACADISLEYAIQKMSTLF